MRNNKPSYISEFIISYLGNKQDKTAILGDLEEEYNDLFQRRGSIRAKLWLWKLILVSFPSFIKDRISRSVIMYKNYLKIALRNLVKHKGYSAINIIGFSIGMACSILIALFIFDELSFDRHNEKADRIYRVGAKFGVDRFKIAFTAPPMAEAMMDDFPEIEYAVRMSLWPRNVIVSNSDKRFVEKKIIYADSSIFNVFTIPLIHGDPNTALRDPRTILLTESIARKYYGDQDPMGKFLTIGKENTPYIITGIVKDCNPKSHFQYDFIVSLSTSENSYSDGWMGHTYFTYIVMKENSVPSQLELKFPEFIKRHYGPQFLQKNGMEYDEHLKDEKNYYNYWLQPLMDIHLASEGNDMLSVKGDIFFVYVLSIIAAFILLIACINFMNLSTARYTKRSKEVGMRKVLGSSRRQLIRQFITESVILSLSSLIIAVIFINAILPGFNGFTEKVLVFNIMDNGYIFPGLILFTLVVGMIAGSYPAFFLSSFSPISVLKGAVKQRAGSNILVRRILVVFQFTISIVILIGTFVVYDQLTYMRDVKLGFNRDNIVIVHRSRALGEKFEAFKQELLNSQAVLGVSNTESLPGRHFNPNSHNLEGRPKAEQKVLWTMYGDHEFAELYNLQLSEGRYFSKDISSDQNAVVINETAVEFLGLTEPLGKRFHKDFGEYREGDFVTVIGVVKDINFQSLHEEIKPMIIRNSANIIANYTSIKIKGGYIRETLSMIEDKWNELTGEEPFQYTFFDDDLNNLYRNEQKTGSVFTVFSALAIFIACLGLFGLISFNAEQRTKEIGIRKTLGAKVSTIIMLLSKEITILVLISAVIASPFAFFGMYNWLQNFAYRTSIHPLVFLSTALLTLLIALITIVFQAYKAARANPVKSLKYE